MESLARPGSGSCWRARAHAAVAVCGLAAVLGCGGAGGDGGAATEEAPRLEVAVTAAPVAWWVHELAGDAVDIDQRFAAHDQHNWSPTPEEVLSLDDADLVVLQGSGYEGWRQTASLPESRVVESTKGLDLIVVKGLTHSHGAQGMHTHNGFDPHMWYAPAMLAQQGEAIAAALEKAVPTAADGIRARLEADRASLLDLDARLAQLGGDLSLAWIVASPDLEYLARTLGGDSALVANEAGILTDALEQAKLQVREKGQRPIVLRIDTDPTPAEEVWPGAEAVTLHSVETFDNGEGSAGGSESGGVPVSPIAVLTTAVEQLEALQQGE